MTSYTNYILSDSLPRDTNGQRMWALPDTASSALGFTLIRAIGASVKVADQVYRSSHLGTATHTQGSPINITDVGNLIMGISNPSLIPSASYHLAAPKAYGVGITQQRELYAAPAPLTASLVSSSMNTIGLSPIVFAGLQVTLIGVTAGDVVRVLDGDETKFSLVATQSNENLTINMNNRTVQMASSLRIETVLTGGNCSATVLFQ